MNMVRLAISVLAVSCIFSARCFGMTISEHHYGNARYLSATGEIRAGDAERLAQIVQNDEHLTGAYIYLSSPGGSMVEAMSMGRIIRKNKFVTVVGSRVEGSDQEHPAGCYSACT